ncbi:MAG: hypothetical protein AABN33_08140 [Acidobacteriota bacterium]
MSADTQLKEASNSATLDGGPVSTLETGRVSKAVNRSKMMNLILFIILLGSSLLYIAAIRPDRFGAYHDDGIYVTTAKALATGEGYRIISLPYEPAQTKYPPFYAFLLSLIWRVYPHFPENLTWMMMLSVAATVGFLALTYRYLVKQGYATGWQALIVVAMAAINWRTMILATGVQSEMVYAGLSVSVLYLAERYEKQRGGPIAGVLMGVMIGLAFLTRSSGLALLIAVGAYYVLRRQWQRAALVVGVGSLFVIAWLGWCYANQTTAEGVNVAYYTSYWRDLVNAINDLQPQNNLSKLAVFLSIIGRNALMLTVFSPPVVCLGIDYGWIQYFGFAFLFIAAGFLRGVSKGWPLLHIYIVSYLVLHFFWLPYVSYDRFLIPLLPFLLLFLITEAQRLISLLLKEIRSSRQIIMKMSAAFICFALLVAAGAIIYNYSTGIYWQLASAHLSKTPGPAPEDAKAIEWIKANTDVTDVLVCYRDPLYYLYTDRRATRSFPMKAGPLWQRHQSLIYRIANENNARYLILTASDFENEYQPDLQRGNFKMLIEQRPQMLVLVFESTDGSSKVYRIENNAG